MKFTNGLAVLVSFQFSLVAFAADPPKNPEASATQTVTEKKPEPSKPTENQPQKPLTQPAAQTAVAPEKYGKATTNSLEWGPKLLVGVLPAASIDGKLWNTLGFSVDVTWMPTIPISGTRIGALGWDANVRWHPWKGAFFVGVGVGNLSVTAQQTQSVLGSDVTATANITSFSLQPTIGWRWVGKSGFFWGMDIGAQIALNVTSPLTHNANGAQQVDAVFINMQNQLNDYAAWVRRIPMPVLAFAIGYYF